ncbi:hypothetical protein MMC31_002904 [Peltigera leucophlebia]|nr:hypothetical protein [Peltigera leucophlebia]
MASSKDVYPAEIGGYGRQFRNEIPDKSRGGLANLAFGTWCPPDIQPDTRIIAICGITDYTGPSIESSSSDGDESLITSVSGKSKKGVGRFVSKTKNLLTGGRISKRLSRKRNKHSPLGLASPILDGWFISDFFMFYHLFKGLGAHQCWIMGESPQDLVSKYGNYEHGESTGEHRVVLGPDLIHNIEADTNIRVFDKGELLKDFLRTFQEECRTAAALHQPILLMIFGHGDPVTYGVAIGGRGRPVEAPRLQTHHIAASLRSLDVALTMLFTSCYSGCWVLQPQLNISALMAASSSKPSWSWPSSLRGRSHGSVYATAVREALIKMEDERVTQQHPAPSGYVPEEVVHYSIYAELASVIHFTLLNDVDRLGSRHGIQFSAKDDVWELEWRKRSGIPLAAFQSRWEALPQMPAQPGSSLRQSKAGGAGIPSSSAMAKATNSQGFSDRFNDYQAKSAIKDLAYGYLNSFPPPDNSAPDRESNLAARSILEGVSISKHALEDLHATLAYRLGLMSLATPYKDLLGLEFRDYENFDYESWQDSLISSAGTSAEARGRWQKFRDYSDLIHKAPVFDPPTAQQGWHYNKPNDYLAASFAESGLTADQVNDATDKIVTG